MLAPYLGTIGKATKRALFPRTMVAFSTPREERYYRVKKGEEDATVVVLVLAALFAIASPLLTLYWFPEHNQVGAFMFLAVVLAFYLVGTLWLARRAWRWWVLWRARRRWGRYQ